MGGLFVLSVSARGVRHAELTTLGVSIILEGGMKARETIMANSPLRYPGGKSKLTGFIGNTLKNNRIDGTFVEPFAGGAGVAINLLLEDQVNRIILNDLDGGVYSFWNTLLTDPDYLLQGINSVPFDYRDEKPTDRPTEYAHFWKTVKQRYDADQYADTRQKGLDFLLLNRMNVSGIIKGGPIGGVAQNGKYNVSSRFNKTTLKKRIKRIAALRDRITVTNLDATRFLKQLDQYCSRENSFLFIDPPYYVQGHRLYATPVDHSKLAEQLHALSGWRWLLTYDKNPEILKLYPSGHVQRFEYQIAYSANKRGLYQELMFASENTVMESYGSVTLTPVRA